MAEQIPLPAASDSPGRARRFVAGHVHRWCYDPIVADVELLTSELVTNAVVHAGGPLVVEVVDDGDGVVVAVADRTEDLPRQRPAAPADPGGRGLGILSAVASSWGVERVEHGKRVWFKVTAR